MASPPLTQEETEEARKKSNWIDRVFLANSGGLGGGLYLPVVVVPLEPKHDKKERWVQVGSLGVSGDVRQPDANREVVCAHVAYGCCPTYWYTDEVTPCLVLTIVLAIVGTILLTPFSLLCTIPAAIQLHKAQEAAEARNIKEAREHCLNWKGLCCGLYAWFWVVSIPAFFILLIVIIAATV